MRRHISVDEIAGETDVFSGFELVAGDHPISMQQQQQQKRTE